MTSSAVSTGSSSPSANLGGVTPQMTWVVAAGLAALVACVAHLVSGVPLGSTTVFLAIATYALFISLWSMQWMVRGLVDDPLVGVDGDSGLAGGTHAELREEKRRVLRAIKELDFDHDMGKISDADYAEVRDRYRVRAVGVMRALDSRDELHPDAQRVAAGERARVSDAPMATQSVAACACGQTNDLDAKFCKACGHSINAGDGVHA